MKKPSLWWIPCLIFCSTLLAAQTAPNKITVNGQVLGKYKDPKRFVRIQLYGPEHYTSLTGTQGKFSIEEVVPGEYRIMVTQDNNVQRFHMTIKPGNQNSLTLVVN